MLLTPNGWRRGMLLTPCSAQGDPTAAKHSLATHVREMGPRWNSFSPPLSVHGSGNARGPPVRSQGTTVCWLCHCHLCLRECKKNACL